MNFLYSWFAQRFNALEEQEREQAFAELDAPLDGAQVVTEQQIEQEGQGFMALMAMTGGKTRATPG